MDTDTIACLILPFVERDQYVMFAMVCKTFRKKLKQLKYPRFTSVYNVLQRVEILQLYISNDFLREKICMFAAQYNRLDVLQWAQANGCPRNALDENI